LSERLTIAVSGPADRLLAAGLDDLRATFAELRGNVVLVGGLMARAWLHLRPVEDLAPRATADIDLGINRQGLRLEATSERVRPLLEAQDYHPLPGEEGFRFQKHFGDGKTLLVDVFVAKGASRREPPILERGITTLAAPGLAYAISRGPVFVEASFVDGDRTTEIELPLPTLDAAFVLKGALAASCLRTRPDRVDRDRVDAVMLAAACLADDPALSALASAQAREPRAALAWLRDKLRPNEPAVAATLERHLREQYGISGGDAWAIGVAERVTHATAPRRR
jgi:hypothetical protein